MKRFVLQCAWIFGLFASLIVYTSVFLSVPPVARLVQALLLICCTQVLLKKYDWAAWTAIGYGYVLDMYSVLPFGVSTIAMGLGVSACIGMQRFVFKNKAIHAIVLNTLVATTVYHAVFTGSVLALLKLNYALTFTVSTLDLFKTAVIQLFIHPIVMVIVYTVLMIIEKRFYYLKPLAS